MAVCFYGNAGHLLHMFWHCPCIKSLWNQVFQLISSLTGILTPPNPALGILHLGIEKFPPHFRSVVTHILLETRNLLLRHWKDTTSTNLSDVVQAVNNNYTFERLLAINAMHSKMFDRKWLIWTNRFHNQ